MSQTMKHNEYWQQRMLALESARYKTDIELVKALEKQSRITQGYIERDLTRWYSRFAENNNISMTEARRLLKTDELEEFKWDVEDYIKYGEENTLDQKWMTQLENASARVHISRLEALKVQMQQQVEKYYGNQLDVLDNHLRSTYTDSYYRTAFEIQKGFNVGSNLNKINTQQLDYVLGKPWAADGKTFSTRIWGNRDTMVSTLQTQLTQSIIRGQAPKEAIDALAIKFNATKRQAGRLIMTESAALASAAQKDCFKELEVEEYEIIATLDSHTSDICRSLDGKVFWMRDYNTGVTAPPFHPNCRTCTAPYFDDEFTEDEMRAARGDDGKTYHIKSDMKYKDWYNTFIN